MLFPSSSFYDGVGGIIMENYFKDKTEYRKLRNKNYNQLETFFNKFIKEFDGKLDPEYIALLNGLYQKIQDSKPKEIPIGFREFFRKYIHFEHLSNDFYAVIWDIELAKKVIESENLQPRKTQVKNLLELVDSDNIDPIKLREAKKRGINNPIIIVEYDPLNAYILIDGNHRVYSKKDQPNLIIEAYVLNDSLSLACMADDVFKSLFALHFNVTKLINYYHKYITKDQLDKLLIK